MQLTHTSIKRPVFMTMVLVAFVLFGGIYFNRMGLDLFPKVEFPVITVVSVLPGADPETVENTVTDPMEEAISTISSIKNLRSKSGDGVSQIIVEFELEKDINIANQEVQAKISAIRSQLPGDLISPVVQKFDVDAMPILSVILSSPLPIETLTDAAKKEVKESIQRIPNVGEIKLVGGQEKKMWLFLDRDKLQSHQITVSEIEQALKMHHIEIPGGRLQTSQKEMPVKIHAEFTTASEFSNWIIADRKGSVVRVGDLGRVEESLAEERSASSFNGTSAIALLVQRQSGSNTVEVAEAVKKLCETLKPKLEKENIHMQLAQDNSLYIHQSVNEVYFHLIFGGSLAVLIVLIFLRNIRSTLVCSLALPTAVIGTFTFMYLMGFTQNVLTLLALSIAIGLLIDDAIVVQENIMRHIEMGHPPKEAARIATDQIALAVLSTTLSVIAVFVPVAFVKGMIGRFFYEFGMTIVFAVSISLFVSLTLNPMFSAYFLKEKKTGRFYEWMEKVFRKIEHAYSSLIGFSLRHRKWVIAIALSSFVIAFFASKSLRFEFRPEEDRSEFQISVEVPKGSSIEVTKNLMEKIRREVQNEPWISYTFTTVGSNQMQSVHLATLYVKMVDKKERTISQDDAMKEIRTRLSPIQDGTIVVESFKMGGGGPGGKSELALDIKGPDLKNLAIIAENLADRMKESNGYRDVKTSAESGKPQINVSIRRDLAADLGVSPMMVASTIKTAIGGTDVAKFKRGADRYNIAVRFEKPFRQSLDQLELLSVKNNMGKLIPLKNVIEVSQDDSPSEINRANRSRQISLYANLDHSEKVIGQAMPEIQKFIDEMDLPAGYSVSFSGMAVVFKESFANLGMALLLAILIVYMVLAAQFESFGDPFIIMMALPLSLIGALGAMVIFHQTMSIFSMIGIIMLMGLVTKNGILLVDSINRHYRQENMPRTDAICRSGQMRLRPILMTTLSVIFGMLPVAIGAGSGSEVQAPMAIAVIGGLITSMLLTLVVVPVVYSLIDDLKLKMKKV